MYSFLSTCILWIPSTFYYVLSYIWCSTVLFAFALVFATIVLASLVEIQCPTCHILLCSDHGHQRLHVSLLFTLATSAVGIIIHVFPRSVVPPSSFMYAWLTNFCTSFSVIEFVTTAPVTSVLTLVCFFFREGHYFVMLAFHCKQTCLCDCCYWHMTPYFYPHFHALHWRIDLFLRHMICFLCLTNSRIFWYCVKGDKCCNYDIKLYFSWPALFFRKTSK